MAYRSKNGRRPDEHASRSTHSHVIKDAEVQAFLQRCSMPKRAEAVALQDHMLLPFTAQEKNDIHTVIAIDGGYTEVVVEADFPSATLAFFQFGALIFSVTDLDRLQEQPFIDPDDMAKLKQIERFKLTLPVRNIIIEGESSLTHTIRRTVYEFFRTQVEDAGGLIATLKWFLFREYQTPHESYTLATCPHCDATNLPLVRSQMTDAYTFQCPTCYGNIFLTDVFRLHEAIDDELGAGGILGYLITSIEQLLLVHLIRIVLRTRPRLLHHIQFIKDGPLAFFGQTANMHRPMRDLVNFLLAEHNLYLAGLEKSGAFVEHADQVGPTLPNGSVLLLDNDYIYRYILPGKADPAQPYGRTTYYSNKVIFKTASGALYVVSLPTKEVLAQPTPEDFPNLEVILTHIAKLRCDMYDNALVPIALVNKLVSLADHPSARILQKFAVGSLGH